MNDLIYENKATSLDNNKQFSQKQFITDLYSCETAIYTLQKRIKEIDKKIKAVDYIKPFSVASWYSSTFYKKYSKIRKSSKQYPDMPKEFKGRNLGLSDLIITCINMTLVAAVVGVIVMIVFCFTDFSRGFEDAAFWIIVLGIIFGPSAFYLISDYIGKSNYLSEMNEYEAACKKIDEENRKIYKENEENEAIYEKQYDEWVERERAKYDKFVVKEKSKIKLKILALQNEKNEAARQLQNAQKTLAELYSLRINGVLCIHPNYQGLWPVSIIYGYFDTGRCSKFEGYEGAYNLYEEERLKGIVVTQLASVAKQLNNLNTTMYYVGQAVTRCEKQLQLLNSNMDSVLGSITSMESSVASSLDTLGAKVGRIEATSARTQESIANAAYYSEVNAKISAFNTFYNICQ